MRYLLILAFLFLQGCASQAPFIEDNSIPKISIKKEIMADCQEFFLPQCGTQDCFMRAIAENAKITARCTDLNRKKGNIIRDNKNYIFD